MPVADLRHIYIDLKKGTFVFSMKLKFSYLCN